MLRVLNNYMDITSSARVLLDATVVVPILYSGTATIDPLEHMQDDRLGTITKHHNALQHRYPEPVL